MKNQNGSIVFNTGNEQVSMSLSAFHRKLTQQFVPLNSKPTKKGSIVYYGYKSKGTVIKAYEEVYNQAGELKFINYIENRGANGKQHSTK